jgi:hypothetical protein
LLTSQVSKQSQPRYYIELNHHSPP